MRLSIYHFSFSSLNNLSYEGPQNLNSFSSKSQLIKLIFGKEEEIYNFSGVDDPAEVGDVFSYLNLRELFLEDDLIWINQKEIIENGWGLSLQNRSELMNHK